MYKNFSAILLILLLTACGASKTALNCTSKDINEGQSFPKFELVLSESIFGVKVKSEVFEDWSDCIGQESRIVCSRKTDLQSLSLNRITGEFILFNFTTVKRTPVMLEGTCKETGMI